MSNINFTTKWLQTLQAPKKQTEIYDTYTPKTGMQFGIRLSPGGTKTWIIRYTRKINGKHKSNKLSLGRYPDMSLKEARDQAVTEANNVLLGNDPGKSRKDKKSSPTLEHAVENEYFNDLKQLGRNSEYIKRLRYNIKGLLGYELGEGREKLQSLWDTPINQITNDDIRDRLALRVKEAPVAANYSLTATRQLFNWVNRNNIDPSVLANPCDYPREIKKPTKEFPRQRFLNDIELASYWYSLQDLRDRQTAKILMLLILNGQRLTATCSIRKQDLIDQWGGVWIIPRDLSKNGKPSAIPLTERSKSILQAAVDDSPIKHSDYIFASDRCYEKGLDKPILNVKKTHEAAVDNSIIKTWVTRHDLRRTIGTHLASMGYNEEWRGRLLNHSDGKSVTDKVYNQYDFLKEKMEMLEAWDKQLMKILQENPKHKIMNECNTKNSHMLFRGI